VFRGVCSAACAAVGKMMQAITTTTVYKEFYPLGAMFVFETFDITVGSGWRPYRGGNIARYAPSSEKFLLRR